MEVAKRPMGVADTASGRARIVSGLDGRIATAPARREVPSANDVPTTHRLCPRLPGRAMPAQHPVPPPSFHAMPLPTTGPASPSPRSRPRPPAG